MLQSLPRRYEEHEVHRFSHLRIFVVHVILSGLLLAALPGCMQMTGGKPDGPWHEAYQVISDPESESFAAEALALAVSQYGEPVIPVNTILLRRSRKTDEARRYRIDEDFSLTECVDPTNGIFVIYLGVDPDHRNYFPLLGHECTHLLNPYIFDWYMEGFATLFSAQICEKTGREWGDWEDYFKKTRREPYGLSYRMMLELQAAVPDEYASIFRYTAESDGGKARLHIDIDAWLDTLPSEHRREAVQIIEQYTRALSRRISEQYSFKPPSI